MRALAVLLAAALSVASFNLECGSPVYAAELTETAHEQEGPQPDTEENREERTEKEKAEAEKAEEEETKEETKEETEETPKKEAEEEESSEEEEEAAEEDAEEEAGNKPPELLQEEKSPSEEEEPEEELIEEENEEAQYHFEDGDADSVRQWMDTHLPGGYRDILSKSDAWWESLYDYERDLAEFIRASLTELDENAYSGQELEEIIVILEGGVPASDFFAGTVFDVLDLLDLYSLRDGGWTLDDAYGCLAELASGRRREESAAEDACLIRVAEKLYGGLGGGIMAYSLASGALEAGDIVAVLSVSASGYSGTGHGQIYELRLGGKRGLCMSFGKSARSGYQYFAGEGEYEKKLGGLGYLADYANLSDKYYAVVQIAAWLYMESGSYTKNQVVNRAVSMLDTSVDEAEGMAELVWAYYQGACQHTNEYYVFQSASGNAQEILTNGIPSTDIYEGSEPEPGPGEDAYETGTVCASAESLVSVEASVSVTKHDSITQEALSGAQIEINGSSYTSGADGTVSHAEKDSHSVSATGPSYTYVVDWGSLTPAQQADADANGYYHSYEEAYAASEAAAEQEIQEGLGGWEDSWSADFHAKETAPPYGYCNSPGNTWDTSGGDGTQASHSFYNKPWEAWIQVVKYDSVTGQTDFSLVDADFSVYEYNRGTGEYEPYRHVDQQLMEDNGDGTYTAGPLYYNPRNEGKFLILETMSPYGYTIDQELNRFYFEITGEQQITYTQGNRHNSAGTYPAAQAGPHSFQAYNEPWKIKVEVDKVDEDTGERLSGVKFDVLRYNQDTKDYELETAYQPGKIEVAQQPDGTYLSGWVYWNYQNQGKFYLVETQAREGYFGDWLDRLAELITGHPAGWQDDDADGKRAYYFAISGSRTEGGVVEGYNSQTTQMASSSSQGTVTNERTKGRVTVVKYDTESESQVPQGEASLSGAVYELRAAEDIIHADGHTGVIYRKGELVMTGTIGKTPVVDAQGYMLNTDGQRYASHGGEIQYKDTPGEFSLYNLELGKYTLKEVKAGEGYMLDETTYFLTFTYDDEAQRVILRDETSAKDGNTLTIDDLDTGHETIYTGDYVQKQAFSLAKTSDNQFQTELVPVEGAGFTVYLVSELQGVKDGSLVPANGENWSGLDIRQFYDYDFSQDQPASVWKRELEAWTEGDRLWLEPAGDGDANEYRVKEMFTDKEGALTSPELPYGTYVVVETTTPEKHVMARPFFVTVSGDGGVVYTDAAKQEIAKAFSEDVDIRYGDHSNAAVYKDPEVYDAAAAEGRIPQPVRYISDNQTETYLRLVKADQDFLAQAGTILEPEKLVAGTVLKEGASYRIRIDSMTEREMETLGAAGWKVDGDGYISYYEPASRMEYGTASCPFRPSLSRSADGKITDCYITLPAKLPTGVYELTELTAPSGYVQNGQEDILVDTSAGRENSYEVTDAPKAPVQFAIDNQSVYPNGQMGENRYTLEDSHGNLVCTVFQDNKEQKGILELVKHGEKLYGAEDTGPSLKEKLNPEEFRFIMGTPEYSAGDYVFDYRDAPIEGAVFDIYAAEDIYTQELDAALLHDYGVDVSRYLVWEKDEKVASITTDKTGYAYLSGLYIGKYYIREVTAGDGFALNQEIKEFAVTKQDQSVNFQWIGSDYENQRQKIDLKIRKENVESGEPLSGAVYGLYNKEDIYSYIMENPDKTVPGYRHIQTVFDYAICDEGRLLIPADTLIATAVTDEDGVAAFDESLPLGEYYVKELEAPLGYTDSALIKEFDMSYSGEKGGQREEIQEWEAVYRNQITKRVITKSDIVSGVYIAGAKMEVLEIAVDEEGRLRKENGDYVTTVVDTWISRAAGEELHYFYEKDGFYMEIGSPEELPDGEELITKEGHLIEGLKVGRSYILRETVAPENYVGYQASDDETKAANQEENLLTEEVRFTVTSENLVVENDMADQRVVGSLAVTKEGEYFTDAEKTWIDKIKDLFYHLVSWLLGRVEKAEFEVYAAQAILDPDGTGNVSTYVNSKGETVALEKDALIDTIETDWTGTAWIHNLPLGRYYFKEAKAGEGFLLNPETVYADLAYMDQDTPVVVNSSVRYENQRQRVEIELFKKGKLTGSSGGLLEAVPGTRFGLYAAEDLYAYTVDQDGTARKEETPVFKAGELIEQTETDASGKAVFLTDLPNGNYYVAETVPAEGYLHDDKTVLEIDASYTGQEGQRILRFAKTFVNLPTEVEVRKLDLAASRQLPGCTLQIVEEWSGKIVRSFRTGTEPERIEKLQLSDDEQEKIYILREAEAAPGYAVAEDLYFKLEQAGDGQGGLQEEVEVYLLQEGAWVRAAKDALVMYDEAQEPGQEEPEPKEEKPEEEKPDGGQPDGGEEPQQNSSGQPSQLLQAPKTGDEAPILAWLLLLAVSAAGAGLLWSKRRKKP